MSAYIDNVKLLLFMNENTGKLTTANNDFTGVLVDNSITRIIGNNAVYIKGGTDVRTSSWLFLYDNSDSSIQNNPNAPFFKITIPTTDTTSYINALCGNINHLTWMNKDIDTVHDSSNNHIRYTSGLLICWDTAIISTNTNNTTITFPSSFKDTTYSIHVSDIDANYPNN